MPDRPISLTIDKSEDSQSSLLLPSLLLRYPPKTKALRPKAYFLICGSSASRKPSPTKLRENNISAIVSPGKINCHGYTARFCAPSAARLPQETRGGRTPRPRNDKNASLNITLGIVSGA